MITIINVTPQVKTGTPNDYVLKINDEEICRFKHFRLKGLAECLEQAAQAVRDLGPKVRR